MTAPVTYFTAASERSNQAEALSDAVQDIDDETLNDQVAEFTENLKQNADAVRSNLEGSQFGEFDVVLSALG